MIIEGDCLEVMKTFPDNHFSAIVTDPPYGLSFMGKGWDDEVPQVSYWKEAFRVSKPGSFLLSMGGTRTFHRLACAIEDAGWEIRDCLSWLYGSGFPKSHNNFGIPGYGTALKPAWEPIIMAMKPCEGTFKQNTEKWGQAGINIDGCRVGTDDTRAPSSKNALGIMNDDGWKCKPMIVGSAKGRWPSNLILDEEAGAMLDEQSGVLKSGDQNGCPRSENKIYGSASKTLGIARFFKGDSGGASRFFYCAKTSSSERKEGIDKNNHPTVKPLALMEYLIKLVMPPKDEILLDPFAGSGSTLVAAKRLGIEAIGIEKQPEYCEIARKRIEAESLKPKQMDLFGIG